MSSDDVEGEGDGWDAIAVTVMADGRADALIAQDCALSRSRIQSLIRAGCVELNGGPLEEPARRLAAGDRVLVHVPPPAPATPQPEAITLDVLYEDEALIVIHKPAGLVVHPGAGHASGTLVNALLHHAAGSLSGIGGVLRPGIVHRLDRDTSGVMVVAKSDAAHHSLAAQFADHGRTGPLRRAYDALVWGHPSPPSGTIDRPLARHPSERQRFAVREGGRHAVTHYETARTFTDVAQLRLTLETGRTHQIRVHMASVGYPLLGDPLYGGSHRTKANRLGEAAATALEALGRQALHASHLAFAHPVTGETMAFDAPPPADLARLSEALAGGA